jgi:hypothetical protein
MFTGRSTTFLACVEGESAHYAGRGIISNPLSLPLPPIIMPKNIGPNARIDCLQGPQNWVRWSWSMKMIFHDHFVKVVGEGTTPVLEQGQRRKKWRTMLARIAGLNA